MDWKLDFVHGKKEKLTYSNPMASLFESVNLGSLSKEQMKNVP